METIQTDQEVDQLVWSFISESQNPHDFVAFSKGNPPDKPKSREVEFSKKEVLREEVKIYRQPDHGCPEAC
jgi:hypothetical protein